MLGNFCLRNLEDVLKVTDTKRPLCKQMDNAQPRCVAEALIYLDQVHNQTYMLLQIYMSTLIYS